MPTGYGQLVDLVEHQYFTAVDELDLDAVLKCFTEDTLKRLT